MDFVGESFQSPDGDDDKVYLFFSENAMEYDFYTKVAVSRVARVCKVMNTICADASACLTRVLLLSKGICTLSLC